REAGFKEAAKRDTFIRQVVAGGATPWIRLKNAGETEHGYEITYWKKEGCTIFFLCLNPEITGSQTGGGNAAGLKTKTVPVTIELAAAVAAVRNERTGQELGGGREFKLDWPMNEALIVSFAGEPPRPVTADKPGQKVQ